MKYPEILKKDDLIGLTATSEPANLDKLDESIAGLNNLGYRVIETDGVRKESIKCVGSDAKTRANEFIQLWKNPQVELIQEVRGGELLMETIPYIHDAFQKEKLYEYAKWVKGYSDITGLLFYLTTWYDIATVEGYNSGSYAMKPMHKSVLDSIKILETLEDFEQESYLMYQKKEEVITEEEKEIVLKKEEDRTYQFNLNEQTNICSLNNEKEVFSGRLIGGCLDVLSIYRGTKWDNVSNFIEKYKDDGTIWHIENFGFEATQIYSNLWAMKESGWFKYVKGFLIGRPFTTVDTNDFTYLDAIERALKEFNVPVIYNVDIGHLPPQWTLINGAMAIVEYDSGKCKIIQKKT